MTWFTQNFKACKTQNVLRKFACAEEKDGKREGRRDRERRRKGKKEREREGKERKGGRGRGRKEKAKRKPPIQGSGSSFGVGCSGREESGRAPGGLQLHL